MQCLEANVYVDVQKQTVRDRIESALQAWAGKWFGGRCQEVEHRFNSALFDSLPAHSERLLRLGDVSFGPLALPEESKLEHWWSAALGDDAQLSDDIKLGYLEEIFEDLLSQLDLTKLAPDQVGCILEVCISDARVLIQFDAQWLNKMLAEPVVPPASGVLAAFENETLNLVSKLSASTVRFRDVISLKPGDVLALDQSVSSHLTMKAGGSVEVAKGFLVASDGMKSFLVESGTDVRN